MTGENRASAEHRLWNTIAAVVVRLIAFVLATVSGGAILSAILIWIVPVSLINEGQVALVVILSLGFATGAAMLRFLRIRQWTAVAILALLATDAALGTGEPRVWQLPLDVVAQLVAFLAAATAVVSAAAVFVYNRALSVLLPGTAGSH